MEKSELTYCGQQVMEQDKDRFRISLFFPPDKRKAMWAVMAFNAEIAKTREVVTETQIGHIRLQWWRDRLEEIYAFLDGRLEKGAWQDNEVLNDLCTAIKQYDLREEDFKNLTYAREFDLENVPPPSLKGLKNYAEYTTTPLNKLLVQIESREETESNLKHISTGYALIGLLRAVPAHARQERIYLPSDLLQKHSVTHGKVLKFDPDNELKEVIREIIEEAKGHLMINSLSSKFLILSQKTALSYLNRIKKSGYDVFSFRLSHPEIFLPLRLWWHYK